MDLNFIEAVRKTPRVKLVLQPPGAIMIEARVARSIKVIIHEHILRLVHNYNFSFLGTYQQVPTVTARGILITKSLKSLDGRSSAIAVYKLSGSQHHLRVIARSLY